MVSAHHASGNWPPLAHLVEHCTSTTELPVSSPKNCGQQTLSFKSRLITINTYFNYVYTSVILPYLITCYAPINVRLLRGERLGIGLRFELRSVFLFKYPAPGKSSWFKKVQIPHPKGTIVGQKSANSPAPSSSQKCKGEKEQQK